MFETENIFMHLAQGLTRPIVFVRQESHLVDALHGRWSLSMGTLHPCGLDAASMWTVVVVDLAHFGRL